MEMDLVEKQPPPSEDIPMMPPPVYDPSWSLTNPNSDAGMDPYKRKDDAPANQPLLEPEQVGKVFGTDGKEFDVKAKLDEYNASGFKMSPGRPCCNTFWSIFIWILLIICLVFIYLDSKWIEEENVRRSNINKYKNKYKYYSTISYYEEPMEQLFVRLIVYLILGCGGVVYIAVACESWCNTSTSLSFLRHAKGDPNGTLFYKLKDGQKINPITTMNVACYSPGKQRHYSVKKAVQLVTSSTNISGPINSDIFRPGSFVRVKIRCKLCFANEQNYKFFENTLEAVKNQHKGLDKCVEAGYNIQFMEEEDHSQLVYVGNLDSKSMYDSILLSPWTYYLVCLLCLNWLHEFLIRRKTKTFKYTYLKMIDLNREFDVNGAFRIAPNTCIGSIF